MNVNGESVAERSDGIVVVVDETENGFVPFVVVVLNPEKRKTIEYIVK